MLKVDLTGTKNSSNRTFTLAQASLGVTLVVWASRVLKEVAVTPGPYECTISGTTVELGSAPGASDMLYAYIQDDPTIGLIETTVYGLQNGSNTTLMTTDLIGTNVMIFKNGSILERVTSSPNAVQYTTSPVGTSFTLGLAPVSTDKFRVFYSGAASALVQPLSTTGNQDSLNTRYAFTNYTQLPNTEPVVMVFADGVLQARVLTPPTIGQYLLLSPQQVLFGAAPAASTSLQFLLVGTLPISTNPYSFTAKKMTQKVQLWLQRRLDEVEVEEVVSQTYREYIDTYQWTFLNVDASFATVAPLTTGTVNVTTGSRVVVGTGTAFTASLLNQRFRLSSYAQSYRITNVDPVNQRLEITPAFVGATATAQPYMIFKSIYSLGPDIEYLFTIASRWPMREVSLGALEQIDPTRASTSDVPYYFAYRGKNDKGEVEIEIYPLPTTATVIRYSGIRRDVCEDPTHILRGMEGLILNASAAAGCRMLMLKPNPATTVTPDVLAQLMTAYEAKAQQVLERIDALDWTRSDVPTVQRMRGQVNPMFDGTYQATHDIWLLGEW